MRNARHGDAANILAPFLAREHQLQLPRHRHRILEKALKEIPHSVQQERVGIVVFEVGVVAHHGRQQLPIRRAVVGEAVDGFGAALWQAVAGVRPKGLRGNGHGSVANRQVLNLSYEPARTHSHRHNPQNPAYR